MIEFFPANVGKLTKSERSVYGICYLLQTGDWQSTGVMPPRGLNACPCPERMTNGGMAQILGTTPQRIAEIVTSLIEKGAITNV